MTIDVAYGPRLLDESPTFANDAERVVWQAVPGRKYQLQYVSTLAGAQEDDEPFILP